jgi:hypothetical protein
LFNKYFLISDCMFLMEITFNIVSFTTLHITALNRVAKDGDITPIIPNLLMSLPLFYNHSMLSKYLVECINYIINVEHYLSPGSNGFSSPRSPFYCFARLVSHQVV